MNCNQALGHFAIRRGEKRERILIEENGADKDASEEEVQK